MKNKITVTRVCPVCKGAKAFASGQKCLYCDGKGTVQVTVDADPNKKKK